MCETRSETEIIQMTAPTSSDESGTDPIRGRHYAGIFLLSVATLLLELSLTRVLSVALFYHFGFLVISTALLGFGVSGVVVTLWTGLRERIPLDHALAWIATLFGVLTLACFWLMGRIPFDPFALFSDRRQWLFISLYYFVLAIPFFCSGLALALLFTRGNRRIHRLYAFDLFGAGIGCGALVLVMPAFGGSGSVAIAAAFGIMAAFLFGSRGTARASILRVLVCSGIVALAFDANGLLPITVTPAKGKPSSRPLFTAWNTFSRIDVFETPPEPEQHIPAIRRIVYDSGTAVTSMHDMRIGVREYLSRHREDADYRSGIAYVGKRNPKVLIIGSGGGAQVLDALHFGAAEITAVDVNPIINELVQHRMNDFWGGLFTQSEVHLVTAEGRSFVRRSHEKFDAIISVHTISNAAIASGALALSEDYVLTREAFEDYLDHLSPDGVIYFTRPEPQIARLFATAREALASRGVQDFPAHFYAFRIPPGELERKRFGSNRPSFRAGLLVKKSAFTRDEILQIEVLLGVAGRWNEEPVPAAEVLYSPFQTNGKNIYRTLLTTSDLPAVYRSVTQQLMPATDDRPFFNHQTRWSSISAGLVRELFAEGLLGGLALGDRPITEICLLVLLVQSVVISAVLILLPLRRFSRAGLHATGSWRFLIYFAGLGFGFISIEMALLSQFTLFLGQPVYTYAVVLASLLICTGIGSYVAGRFEVEPRRMIARIIPLIVLALIATAFATPLVFSAALGWPLPLRILLAIVILMPLGVLLGVPFPTGMGLVSLENPALIPWGWGVNGFFTVIGTVIALLLGMTWGFKVVLVVGGCSYLMALVATTQVQNRAKQASTGICEMQLISERPLTGDLT